jgi:DNA-binding NtrC family response regulator
VIFLTAYGNVNEAVHAIKEGARDYLVKPVSFDQLKQSVQRILDRNSAEQFKNHEFVGSSANFRTLLANARRVAKTDADVLVQAESGTGKELLARMIHNFSPRANRPFVAINCSAFPESLLESELFGHVRGAFTGATASKAGKFQLADGGTLLLDEIGEMPLSLQPKLLRVLQEREVDRLGDTHPFRIDVRVIATTNRSLTELIDRGQFRNDLYYRLNVVPLTIPPLRERRPDIPELAEYFLRKYEPKAQRGQFSISPELAAQFCSYDWPGNIRELENAVRRALALAHGTVLEAGALDSEWGAQSPVKTVVPKLGQTLEAVERKLLESTLRATGGNRTHAAEMMGVSLRTVRNKIREYGLAAKEAV